MFRNCQGMIAKNDGWRIPDRLWECMEALLPPPMAHPLGCHNPPKNPRYVMNAILFVLRTGCQWNALNGSGLCGSLVAHRWFTRWAEAGVFKQFWLDGLLAYDLLSGIDWSWCSADGAMASQGACRCTAFRISYQHE